MKLLFKERLRLLRAEKNLTQTQLAEKLNTTQRKISYWENGATEPSLADLIAISEILEVSLDFLLGKTDY